MQIMHDYVDLIHGMYNTKWDAGDSEFLVFAHWRKTRNSLSPKLFREINSLVNFFNSKDID